MTIDVLIVQCYKRAVFFVSSSILPSSCCLYTNWNSRTKSPQKAFFGTSPNNASKLASVRSDSISPTTLTNTNALQAYGQQQNCWALRHPTRIRKITLWSVPITLWSVPITKPRAHGSEGQYAEKDFETQKL